MNKQSVKAENNSTRRRWSSAKKLGTTQPTPPSSLSRHSVGALQKGFDASVARSSRTAASAVTPSDHTTRRAGPRSAACVTPPYVESVKDHQRRLRHPPPWVPTSPPAAHKARATVCRLAATGAAAATRTEARACSLHAPGQAPARGRATTGSGRCSARSVARGPRRRGRRPLQ